MFRNVVKNYPTSLDIRVTDSNGKWVTGLDVYYKIINVQDNNIVMEGLMCDLGSGVYKVDITLSQPGQYRVLYDFENFYQDSIETIIVQDDVFEQLTNILTITNNINTRLGITSGEYIESYNDVTSISRKDESVFSHQYDKLIEKGYSLFKIEGIVYYFKR